MNTKTDFRPLSLLVGGAFFMEQLDTTIIAPAIPQIALSLGTDPLRLNMAMTAYLLCLVIFIPISGAFADRFGTRTVFRVSVALFTFSSVLCGLSNNLYTLVAARALQGASGAMMIPVGRIAIVRTVARSDLVSALAWMITPAMLGPLVGPPLGGFIATYASWRWVFYINVPFGLAAWWLASRYIPQIRTPDAGRFDVPGWLLLCLSLAGLVIGLEVSHQPNFSRAETVFIFAVTLATGVAYYVRSRGQSEPLLDFSLMDTETFRVSLIAGTLVRIGYGSLPFLLPLALQLGLGFSAVQSGIALLGSAVVAIIMKTWTAVILRRYGFKQVLIWNGIFCALGLAVCAIFREGWGLYTVLVVLMIGGIARSVQFNALAAIAYADIPPHRTAAATSLNTTFQQLAATLGIALSVWILEASARFGHRSGPDSFDFSLAFLAMTVIALLAIPCCFRLNRHAGAELTGQRTS